MITDLECLLIQILPEEGIRGAPFDFRKASKILTQTTHERMPAWKIRRAWKRLCDNPCTADQVKPLNPGKRRVQLSALAMRMVAAEALHYDVPVYWKKQSKDLQKESLQRQQECRGANPQSKA